MSLAKIARYTTTPVRVAAPAQTYSKTCPGAPPATPTPVPPTSGGAAGCFQVPVYTQVPVGAPDGNGVYHQFTYELTGYTTVCY
jgi:hypothetical protein